MEKTELLASLNVLTERYATHRHFIEKAQVQASTGKFNSVVIQKVITDHEAKSAEVAASAAPLLPELAGALTALEADKAGIEASRGGVDEQIQELELRMAIGELSEPDFEREVAGLRSNQAGVNERIAAIDLDWQALSAGLERWAALAGPAGHYVAAGTAPAEVEPVAELEAELEAEPAADLAFEAVADEVSVEVSIDVQLDEALAVDSGNGVGFHSSRPEIREDLSDIFPSAIASVQVSLGGVDDVIAIETGEIGEEAGDAPSADVPFGFDDAVLSSDAPVVVAEVEIDLGKGELSGATSAAAPAEAAEAPRRALLLYQEGTAEEQIYPFTSDALTIGRGRENDIQIKNDSKVSRYHCKLFRRGNNFYIEDQKSSNGSLVNGELITDRRLFGGEEIIIGETFFRFRIME